MISIDFSGKIVMAMHIVTMEVKDSKFIISLSNGLVLEESFSTDEERIAIAHKLANIIPAPGKQP